MGGLPVRFPVGIADREAIDPDFVAQVVEPLKAAAREREKAGGARGGEGGRGKKKPVGTKNPRGKRDEAARTDAIIAKTHGTTRANLAKARKIRKSHPKLAAEIRTAAKTISQAEGELKHAEAKAKIAQQVCESPSRPEVFLSSWSDWLPSQPDCDLLLTDPPYSTDVEDIAEFARGWLPIALSKVKPTGTARSAWIPISSGESSP